MESAIKELTEHGHAEKDVAAKVKSITGDLYAKGEISQSQAQSLLKKYGRKTSGGAQTALEDTDVWGMMNQLEYKKLTGESSASDYAMIYYAVSNQQSPKAYIDDALAHGKSRSAIASGLTSRYREEYQRLLKTDLSAASVLKGRLCAVFDYLGYNGLKTSLKCYDYSKQFRGEFLCNTVISECRAGNRISIAKRTHSANIGLIESLWIDNRARTLTARRTAE